MAIHSGEGVNHWFHRTTNGRGAAMITILTGNQGKFGTGRHNWSGNYKTGIPQGTPWSGGGIGAWGAEDAFQLNLDATAHGKEIKTKYYGYGEEPAYWNHGDRALIVKDRKSTRLNSSHGYISYAVFCLKKKKKDKQIHLATSDPARTRQVESAP